MSSGNKLFHWDKVVFFEIMIQDTRISPGELIIDQIDEVEDLKGNSGHKGKLMITNKRLMWISNVNSFTNLSIGLNCIQGTNVKQMKFKNRGSFRSLLLYAKYERLNLEFIFSCSKSSVRLCTVCQTTVKAYQSTTIYRELKLKCTLFKQKNLIMLPEEVLDDVVEGVWNLAGDQGHLGKFYITNIRIVWSSMMNEVFNMSLPYVQIIHASSQDSKYGKAIVFETSKDSGSLLLGFRCDPVENLKIIQTKALKLWSIAIENPILGVKVDVTEIQDSNEKIEQISVQPKEILDIKINDERKAYLSIDEEKLYRKKYFNQYVQDEESLDSEIVFDETIGLSIEKIKIENKTLQDLWMEF